MINRVQVFYEGWNERWHWGTLATSTNPLVRPFYQNARKTPPFRAGRIRMRGKPRRSGRGGCQLF